jgi:hypothetical protein
VAAGGEAAQRGEEGEADASSAAQPVPQPGPQEAAGWQQVTQPRSAAQQARAAAVWESGGAARAQQGAAAGRAQPQQGAGQALVSAYPAA